MQDNDSDRANRITDPENPGESTAVPLEAVEARKAERPTGRRLRIYLVVANIALGALCLWFADFLIGGSIYFSGSVFDIGLKAGLQTVRFAPVLLLTVLAAWGPWRAWLRGLLFVGLIAAETVLQRTISLWGVTRTRSEAPIWLETLDMVLEMLVVLVPAALCLALLGAWLSLRIGPVGYPPVRSSIFSVMIATGALAAVMAGKLATDRAMDMGGIVIELGANESVQSSETRSEIFLQTLYGGTIFAVMIGCMVAAAYRWWARIFDLLLISAYGGISYYFARQAAPQFPYGQPNILLVFYVGMIVGLLVVCFWIPINIRLIDRSGWPCSRRRRIVATRG